MQIKKYQYKYFEEVPKRIEIVYNKIGRREQYLNERDCNKGLIYYGSEEELFNLQISFEEKAQEIKIHQALQKALVDLRALDPIGYKLIDDFYFDDETHNYSEMSKKYGISRQAYTKRLKKHLIVLKNLVIYHIENDT